MSQTTRPYDNVARSLHWLILALLVVQFTLAWTMPHVGRDTKPVGLVGWHISVGAAILAVMILRLAWRLTHPAPPPPADLNPALRFVSRATHLLLYLVLLVMPVEGWINANARGWTVRLFGAIPLPKICPTGAHWGHKMGDIHGLTGWVLLTLIGLHVLGALYHRIILRDGTLGRMLPGV